VAALLEQSTYATVAKYQSRTCTAVFDRPTKQGSLLVAVVAAAGTLPSNITGPSGWSKIVDTGLRDMQMAIWIRANAPATLFVSTTSQDDNKSQQLRVFEWSGMAQTNTLDKVTVRQSESRDPFTGSTGNTAIGDELVMGFVANQYASTSQYGFQGNLSRLYESTSPQGYSRGSNQDWERSRLSVHAAIPSTIGNFSLSADLSTTRRWMAALVTFRGGTSGPARMSSTANPSGLATTGSGDLTAFGPLQTGLKEGVATSFSTGGELARVGPFNYQYRLGGWGGLLIGSGTRFLVESTEGLGGIEVRTSDDDLPRNDGALRGIDLASSRTVVFRMNVGRGREEAERNMAALMRWMMPQREEDIELLFRFPTLPLQMLRCRPIRSLRRRDGTQISWTAQEFALQAADPRIYSAISKTIDIPVTPGSAVDPVRAQVVNIGNSAAYPKITIYGPPAGAAPVTRLQLVNETALVNFEAELMLLPGSILTADMDARIRGSAISPISLDGQAKYGAWQLPREPFRIDPDPAGFGGYNEIYLRTEPAGAAVRCTLEYRDTWMG
jgi:hypothetical protein